MNRFRFNIQNIMFTFQKLRSKFHMNRIRFNILCTEIKYLSCNSTLCSCIIPHFMLFQIWLVCCSIFTLVTRICYFFMLVFLCLLTLDYLVAANSHWSLGYVIPSCLLSLCLFISDDLVALYSHWLQGYSTPSCQLCLWCFISYNAVAKYSHWSQGNVSPSC